MSNRNETQIVEVEEQLRLAMLQSDVRTLNDLLAPDLIFTNHLGQTLSKNEDLDAHQSGTLKIEALTPSEQHIKRIGDVAIVSVRARIVGSYAGTRSESDFRFTRVWALRSTGHWQVVAAHSSLVAAT